MRDVKRMVVGVEGGFVLWLFELWLIGVGMVVAVVARVGFLCVDVEVIQVVRLLTGDVNA